MNDIQLRRMTASDVAAVSALARIVWQVTYPALISQAQIEAMLGDRYAANHIRAQLHDPAQGWWIAQHNHTLAGFAHAMMDDHDCKLDKLYIHPDRQHQGLGGMLLNTARQWAQQQHTHRLWLQVNRGNAPAIAAYTKYGFRIVESRVFEIGDGFVMDDHVMEQVL